MKKTEYFLGTDSYGNYQDALKKAINERDIFLTQNTAIIKIDNEELVPLPTRSNGNLVGLIIKLSYYESE